MAIGVVKKSTDTTDSLTTPGDERWTISDERGLNNPSALNSLKTLTAGIGDFGKV
jgi:hypothetical protein